MIRLVLRNRWRNPTNTFNWLGAEIVSLKSTGN
jgi:hypothetical protein